LSASHYKPWRDCSNEGRLEGENGLLLTPSIDHLLDRGFIDFLAQERWKPLGAEQRETEDKKHFRQCE
jgi:hypothetical protein